MGTESPGSNRTNDINNSTPRSLSPQTLQFVIHAGLDNPVISVKWSTVSTEAIATNLGVVVDDLRLWCSSCLGTRLGQAIEAHIALACTCLHDVFFKRAFVYWSYVVWPMSASVVRLHRWNAQTHDMLVSSTRCQAHARSHGHA